MGKRIEREVESYVNDFEQTIRVGDEVVYPVRWGSSLELKRGRVVRIYEFDRDRYDWETKGNKVEALRRVVVERMVERNIWHRDTSEYESKEELRTITIQVTQNVIKLITDASLAVWSYRG